ncbi:hypothetical protein Baya_13957 [Bagarius yarrelli]|uniref:Uncharacterized protein n=1 Tax=Bagarius yarrelli TaxID=175774 RepID=A0A556V742_BAGYA|nr:hypothetical protein Baya_13957 [Bagarius yarrelli]
MKLRLKICRASCLDMSGVSTCVQAPNFVDQNLSRWAAWGDAAECATVQVWIFTKPLFRAPLEGSSAREKCTERGTFTYILKIMKIHSQNIELVKHANENLQIDSHPAGGNDGQT